MYTVRVQNLRRGPFGKVLAFFSLVVGEEAEDGTFEGAIQIDDFALRSKEKDGQTKYYYLPPGKPRMREGQPVFDEDGNKIFDNLFRLYTAKRGDRPQPTKLAWEVHKSIVTQATEAYEAAGEAHPGRGAAPRPVTTASARAGKPQNRTRRPAREQMDDEGEDWQVVEQDSYR